MRLITRHLTKHKRRYAALALAVVSMVGASSAFAGQYPWTLGQIQDLVDVTQGFHCADYHDDRHYRSVVSADEFY